MNRLAIALTIFCAAAPAAAQQNIRNADLQQRPAGDLARTIQQLATEAGPLWIGYRVPAQDPDWNSCCHDRWSDGHGCCGRCAIEDTKPGDTISTGQDRGGRGPVALESQGLIVMVRFVERQVDRIRVFSESCDVDAGGRRVYWLTDVQPKASVAWLRSVATGQATDGKNRVVSGAIMALSAHGEPAAMDALIDLAKNDASSRVRGDALFWLSQNAGRKAVGAISDAIANDPDTRVKEKAVFALSQLPKDEGVPKLIEVARTNRNPVVRKRAIFWLGQTKDPRALKFFEEILSK